MPAGCFTCRVRRKKCDESRPSCGACSSLCLKCDYHKPSWWVSAEHRRVQKDRIKDRIRHTKVMEKEGSMRGMCIMMKDLVIIEINQSRLHEQFPGGFFPAVSH